MTTVAERLQKAMDAEGLSQAALARKSSVPQPTIFSCLNGGDPRISTYRKLVAALPAANIFLDAAA